MEIGVYVLFQKSFKKKKNPQRYEKLMTIFKR